MSRNRAKVFQFALIGLLVFTVVSHLFNLTALPVFADEAIYIRWAQLMIDDFSRYAFFPLNDGKTPLFMWLVVPLLNSVADPLIAGRLLSVIAGLVQVVVMYQLGWDLTKRKTTALLAGFLTAILPFWFFYHRLAITDALMTLWLSISIWMMVKAFKLHSVKFSMVSGFALGLALLSKLPAVLIIPCFVPLLLLPQLPKHTWLNKIFLIGITSLTGLLLFVTLKIHPAFGQLFSRGGDFLYPLSSLASVEVLTRVFSNTWRFGEILGIYLTYPLFLIIFAGLFVPRIRRVVLVLIASTGLYLLPIILLGKIVYPRYLLPASLFITLAGAISFQGLVDLYVNQKQKLLHQTVAAFVIVMLFTSTVLSSLSFMLYAYWNPDYLPLFPHDRAQYITDWSSGEGIKDTVSLIQDLAKKEKVLVLTEGHFGTLPDGILMYLHRQNVENLFVEGIGQPVLEIPAAMKLKAQDYDKTLLVVNSHRNQLQLADDFLITQYCRPFGAPCLQVWDVTSIVKDQSNI